MRKKPHAHAPDRTSPGPSPIPGGERIAARADSARHPKVPHRRNGQGFSGKPSNGEGRLQGRPVIALVVPCYNESAALEQTVPRLTGLVGGLIADRKVNPDSFIVLVDDGSRDDTWAKIEQAAADNPRRVQGISLCRNYGHQYALLCGLEHVTGRCDAAVSIDADLQDDIGVIPDMIDQYLDGKELVFGVRKSRGTDSWFKRNTALLFYRLMAGMGVPIVENHADFRLMSHTTLANLRRFGEVNLFLRGLSTLLHKHTGIVYYDRTARNAGDTKYPLSRMLALAWRAVTSFSIAPLRIISLTGGCIFLISLGMSAWALTSMFLGRTVPGWSSVVIPVNLLGGILMLSIGIVGEYLAMIFMEVKNRPRYLVDRVTDNPRPLEPADRQREPSELRS